MAAPAPEEFTPPVVLVLLVRLIWIAMWALLGASIGTFLTPVEAGVLLACGALGYAVWRLSRPSLS